jgi:murein DD-endopeptidase MepM/ murein hydrolase activator NlpD
LIGIASGLAVLLAIPIAAGLLATPSSAPAGNAVSGQEPTPAGSPVPATSSSPATPAITVTAAALPGPAMAAFEVDHGIRPQRIWMGDPDTRAPALDTLEGYRWPLAHPRLTLPFGPTPWGSRLVDGQTFHDGVDLATFCNDKVLAAHAGTVLAAGRHYDDVMGWIGSLRPYYNRLDRMGIWRQLPIVIVVDDGNGYRSMYAHMWKITVKAGDTVKAGQVMGFEGMTGRASGCHLHYGLFSPQETATFRIKPDVAKRMKLPKEEIARVDPLLVLPPRAGINAPAKSKASPAPSASPTP